MLMRAKNSLTYAVRLFSLENVEKVFTFFISDGIIQVEIFYLLAVALGRLADQYTEV